MEKDLHSNILGRLGLSVQTISTDTTTSGEIIDTKGFESAEWIYGTGTVTDGDYAYAIWQSEAANMAGATVVPAAETLGGVDLVADTDDDLVHRIGSVGKMRYQQLRVVSTNTSSGGTNNFAICVLGNPAHGPISDTAQ